LQFGQLSLHITSVCASLFHYSFSKGMDDRDTFSGGDAVVQSRQSYGSKLADSCIASIIGIVLFLSSFVLLWWNEGNTLYMMKALEEAQDNVDEVPCRPIDPANNKQLVHISCDLENLQTFKEPNDLGVSATAAFFRRHVEMYQYAEDVQKEERKNNDGSTTTTTTYSYRTEWSPARIRSEDFRYPDTCVEHGGRCVHCRNPALNEWPMVSSTQYAEGVTAGDFSLSKELLQKLTSSEPVQPVDSGVYNPSQIRPPQSITGSNTHVIGSIVYTGNSNRPKVGDMRISWSQSSVQAVSVIAQQQGRGFVSWRSTTRKGYTVMLLDEGMVDAAEMFARAMRMNNLVAWVLRLTGFVLMVFGITLVGKPLGVVADIIPFFGSMIGEVAMLGVAMLACVIAFPLSVITICLAWVWYRPIVLVPFVASMAFLMYFLYYFNNRRGTSLPPPTGVYAPPYQTYDGAQPSAPAYKPQFQGPPPPPYQPQPPPQGYQPPPAQGY
jgi:hypothetical protein